MRTRPHGFNLISGREISTVSYDPRGEDTVSRKPTLVLLSGLLCDRALWAPQIEALSELCEPWVADLTRDDTVAVMAERALAEAPSDRFALAALSMGGYVAMEIMRQSPQRVTRLALFDTRVRLDTAEETERRRELVQLAQAEG